MVCSLKSPHSLAVAHWQLSLDNNVNVHDGTCYRDTISVYESAKPHPDVKRVCAHSTSDVLGSVIMNVVGQPNANDCGLHAIAYATELAHGSDPQLGLQ